MTSCRAGGLENREPLKPDYKWRELELAFPLLPGPGARPLHAESMRHFRFYGTSGHSA
jgi:hypothetical protein